MKKIAKILLVLLIFMSIKAVHAANYNMKELIPENITTTIKGKNILYKNIVYKNNIITIEKIKNLSDEPKPITISIGLFDKNKKNLGIINYCKTEKTLESKEEKLNYEITIDENIFDKNTSIKDIKYISVISENSNCRLGGTKEFIGKKVEEINQLENNSLSEEATLLINIFKIIIVILIVLFLYKFLFTGAYKNIDGEDIRDEYKYINKQKEKERKENIKNNPPKEETVKPTKTKEVLEQEKIEKEREHKDDSNLHNFYK